MKTMGLNGFLYITGYYKRKWERSEAVRKPSIAKEVKKEKWT